jgi:hypothetical protein
VWFGCAGVPAAQPPQSTPDPQVARTVSPEQLADPGVRESIPHWVRLASIGKIWLDTGRQFEDGQSDPTEAEDVVLPVIAATKHYVRIVISDYGDTARLAVWVPRSDLRVVNATTRQLVDRAGAPLPIWLAAGATFTLVEQAERQTALVQIRIDDDELDLESVFLPATELTQVFVADRQIVRRYCCGDADAADADIDDRYSLDLPGASPTSFVEVSPRTELRATASPSAAVVARVGDEAVVVGLLARQRGALEVEVRRREMVVRGFVDASLTSPRERDAITHRRIRGMGGFGSSHADMIAVPASTCLFASIDGALVGVAVANKERYGRLRTERPDWAMIYLGTEWGIGSVYIQRVAGAWASCAPPDSRSSKNGS